MDDPIPHRVCGIVMKGGLTSGVVYPLAIVELAKEFRFRCIGGTSAGAIAAAVTAAAEYRRIATQSRAGFDHLATLPDFLAGTTNGQKNLLNLFPPTPEVRRLFAVAASFLGRRAILGKSILAALRLLLVSPVASLVAFLPAIATLALARVQSTPLAVAATLVIFVLMLVLGVVGLVVYHCLQAAATSLPDNNFGFSKGLRPKDRQLPGITDWLHRTIQEAAGRGEADAPLTFGDLWTADLEIGNHVQRRAAAEQREEDEEARAIELQMVTTALTHGSPQRLPFDSRRFFFVEKELRDYFPKDVVDYLVEQARLEAAEVASRTDTESQKQAKSWTALREGMYQLPPARSLPLVVAARMSLSFPLLFSMVPLYAVDFTFKKNQGDEPEYERCWFIDGGLSSNFPVSLFDSLFPRWPTFCVDLTDFHPQYPEDPKHEDKNVWMVERNGDGTSDHWTRFAARGWRRFRDYVGAMLDTIRNWRDNTQLIVPGFRDRIVHVCLSPQEGGLNLDLDKKKVGRLTARGHLAGVRLRERFGVDGAMRPGLNWNTHRCVRYRTSMVLLQKAMRNMHIACAEADSDYPSYRQLIDRKENLNPKLDYWWDGVPEPYQDQTDRFLQLAKQAAETPVHFADGAPHPRPELRVTPRI